MSAQNNVEEKKPLDMKQITRILKTPSESRTLKQCQELLDIIGDLQFFREYNSNPSTANVPKLCCKYMEIEKFEQDDIIFEFGSVGNKFYIIFQGTVGIYIQKPQSILDKEKEEKKDEKKKESQEENEDKLATFMCVKELGDGSAFGELALLNNKPRLATIKCLKETYVATLSKENFNKILKEHEEQKLNKEIQFFEKVPAFKDFNQKQIRYLCLNNKTMETQKNEVIYDEKDPCDCLYVIKEGEFEVYKSVEKQVDHKEEIMKQSILSLSVLNKNSSQKISKSIKIKVLSVGEICGEEFILNKKQREFKLVCSSFQGVIVRIKTSDFLRKLSEDAAVQKAFFQRFKLINEEFQERVEKRIQQFHEYKNFLVQDSIPTKIKMSIDKLYSNNNMTPQKKEESISEFRKQIVEMENLQKKNEHQQAILSKLALSQRFNHANSLMFSNQVQYLKYKRLSIIADASSKTPSARLQSPPNSNRDELNSNNNRRSSFSSAAVGVMNQLKSKDYLKEQSDSPPQQSDKVKMHSSMIDIEDTERSNGGYSGLQEKSNPDNLKSIAGRISPKRLNNNSTIKRKNFLKNGQNSSENNSYHSNPQSTSSLNTNLYQLGPLNVKQNEERKLNDGPASPIQSFNTPTNLSKSSHYGNGNSNSTNNLGKRSSKMEQNDFENSPKLGYIGLSKNKSAMFSNQNSTSGQKVPQYQYSDQTEPPRVEAQLYQFNVSNKRLVKFTNVQKDNFIRDWKKNNNIYEDAQQQSLIRKIKKITSQSNKFGDYFKQQMGSLNDSAGQIQQQQGHSPQVYPIHISSKSENISFNTTPQPLLLPKIYENSPSNQNTNQTSFTQNPNSSIISNNDSDSMKKNQNPQNPKPLQMKSIFLNVKETKEKKRQLLIVSQ